LVAASRASEKIQGEGERGIEREKREEGGGREREREGTSVPVWDCWWLAVVKWWVAGRHLTNRLRAQAGI